ncbi:SSU ribosomal protein S20P [Desulfonatronum thiosulfatophilum]|uniref:Small ribosomal subunit protein bS20 n=1 Tax=Desulfonatronum thiosulfatophilum TaxID=617002 RepID=A0A1G6DSI9_9BACT|nr:30S ribosomal protein S20 [Desulfonatronum thiosulfatophilum]SDB47745.1 SSU ribosomal protein S20P [Desulfonatronum thiosulfatophilum]
MANHPSAIKRHRQSLKAQARNKAIKTRIKNAVKAVRQAVEQNDQEQARAGLIQATAVLDKAAGKKVIHWGNAARKVSRLTAAVNNMQA